MSETFYVVVERYLLRIFSLILRKILDKAEKHKNKKHKDGEIRNTNSVRIGFESINIQKKRKRVTSKNQVTIRPSIDEYEERKIIEKVQARITRRKNKINKKR